MLIDYTINSMNLSKRSNINSRRDTSITKEANISQYLVQIDYITSDRFTQRRLVIGQYEGKY